MPFPILSSQLRIFITVTALGAFVGLAGCSDRPPRPEGNAEEMAPAAPELFAQTAFFDGKIVVDANLGRGFSGVGGRPGGGGGHHGGGGHFHGGGGMGRGRGGHEGGEPEGGGMPADDNDRPMMEEASLPPVALRLRLTNTGKDTVEVTFVLCKSELGDFAVQPEKLALAPGQEASPDPMTSRLGLTSEDLVLHLALRMNGHTESHDVNLTPKPPTKP